MILFVSVILVLALIAGLYRYFSSNKNTKNYNDYFDCDFDSDDDYRGYD